MIIKSLFLLSILALQLMSALATNYYVATNGSDSNSGSVTAPFLTIMRAQNAAVAGDNIYIRGGTYKITSSQIASDDGTYSYINTINKSGTSGKRISYVAYSGETPVFDLSAVKPSGRRVCVFYVTASYVEFKGFEVIGTQVTITTHTQSECFRVENGSNNVFERLKLHNGMANGIYMVKKSANNLVLNCDAYQNWDNVSEDKSGGNTDGFGCHVSAGGTGNIFRGCRAWFNSDDGYDCLDAQESVTFDHCWAFYNGYSTSFASLGNGNGFKAGGYGTTNVNPPSTIPKHTIEFCLAVQNKSNGFYSNHHIGGSNWYNNSAYLNSTNYNMLSATYNASTNATTDVPGYGHKMRNNLGYAARSTEVSNLDQTKSDVSYNYFTLGVTVSSADFLSLDESLLTTARQSDGSLPNNNFMKLPSGSDLLNKGQNIGFAYIGTAPDLGYCESTFTKSAENEGQMAVTNNSSVLGIKLYPNPTDGHFTVDLNGITLPGELLITNLSGQEVLSKKFSGGENLSVNISSQPKGLYIVKLLVASETYTYKIVTERF